MDSPIIGGLLAFLGGTGISAINYLINIRTLRSKPEALVSRHIICEILSVAYFITVYVLRDSLPWDMMPLLVGAALGLTIPNILFSMRIAKINDAMNREAEKGEDHDG